MSKHTNKYWLKEKEYILLKNEYDIIWKELHYTWKRRGYSTDSIMKEVSSRLRSKFFNEEHGSRNTSPHWFRNKLNRMRRYRSRRTVNKIINNYDYEYIFDDNYKDASWLYW